MDPDDLFKSSSTPRSVKGGIKPANSYGNFATTWLGKRWIETLESFQIGPKLLSGKRYARAGQVMEIDIRSNRISAIVQGSRLTPYEVIIEFQKWAEKIRLKVIDIIKSNGYLLGSLFTGDIPKEFDSILTNEGIKLFPDTYDELRTSCTCPERSIPCKHIVAVSYLLALELDRDPTLILQLRGLSITDIKREIEEGYKDDIIQEKKLEEEQRKVLLNLLKRDNILQDASLSKIELIPKKPLIDALNIKRLGTPPFWRSDIDFIKLMEEIYKYLSNWGQDKSI